MKILFVVEHFYPYVGGAEELFLNLAVSLANYGYDVSVVTTKYDKNLASFEEFNRVKITRVNCYNRFLFTFLALGKIIRNAKHADFIHTTSYNSAIPACIAGLLLKKKVIITFHEVWGKLWAGLPFTPKWKLKLFALYEQLILKLPFSRYVAVSDYTMRSLIENGIKESKIIRIYNGLDYETLVPYRYSPPEIFTFCFYGRLGISKGLDILLEGANMFFAINPDSRLKLIIPDYPAKLYRKVLKKIYDMQYRENIILMHNLSKEVLFGEVCSSNCVIIPSYSEGFCYVAVEAAGMNVPVISSGKGSLSEVVSGNFIMLDDLSAVSVKNALVKGMRNEYEKKILRPFTLKESVGNYINMYESLRTK
jgi:glycosyltransferase involved in cell wall biosynthesis